MKNEVQVINGNEWAKKLMRNKKNRERYYIKRYGSLERMFKKEGDLQDYMDKESFDDECDRCGIN